MLLYSLKGCHDSVLIASYYLALFMQRWIDGWLGKTVDSSLQIKLFFTKRTPPPKKCGTEKIIGKKEGAAVYDLNKNLLIAILGIRLIKPLLINSFTRK
jgi:hypothetical protein